MGINSPDQSEFSGSSGDKGGVVPAKTPLAAKPESTSTTNPGDGGIPHAMPLAVERVAVENKIPIAMPLAVGQEHNVALNEILGSYRHLPEQFQKDASAVASYVLRLDRNPQEALTDPNIRDWITKISQISWIIRTQRYIKNGASETLLPEWLRLKFLTENNIALARSKDTVDMHTKLIQTALSEFTEKNGLLPQPNSPSYYRVAPSGENLAPLGPQKFKVYVQGIDLLASLKSNNLARVFGDLSEQGTPPTNFKLDGQNLVIYFNNTDIQSAEGVTNIFDKLGIAFRGPAQDVMYGTVDSSGKFCLQTGPSNDQAMNGIGLFPGYRKTFEKLREPYDPTKFLGYILDQCADEGKSPKDPYRTSFVNLVLDQNNQNIAERDFLISAQAACGYPVIPRIGHHDIGMHL